MKSSQAEIDMAARIERSTAYLERLEARERSIRRRQAPGDVVAPLQPQEAASLDAQVKAAEQDLYRTLNLPTTPLRQLRAQEQRVQVRIAEEHRRLRLLPASPFSRKAA